MLQQVPYKNNLQNLDFVLSVVEIRKHAKCGFLVGTLEVLVFQIVLKPVSYNRKNIYFNLKSNVTTTYRILQNHKWKEVLLT